ncbi:class I SAM-dependent methyltransferase [Neobacillus mesonae]|uniref:class I SAM-dependent methyltransferase n=1 Tax=Neobacillus mesonae TaxID=1193713 RepID=UPI00203B52B7|nr:class I SAM-dependent methyltransferase [Neobacillus mesonae]MCM3571077.1 class I SAM-dependent methyltransferase [Neobacillus mesonae]
MDLTGTHKINFTEEKQTLLITLYAKALDSRLKNSILNDRKAEEILHMIDYDFEKINSFGNEIMVVRAKQLDTWVQEFMKENPNASVLNLGCGLDTRISRINPPSTIQWFDVDFPEVIELRKSFFSNHEGYEMISSSVMELNWLEQIPRNKPVMVIAEGMLEYLTEKEVKDLVNRLTSYFPAGKMAFDVMNSFAVNSGKEELKQTTGAIHKWSVNDLHDVDQLDSKLKRADSLSVFKSKFIHKLPLKTRLLFSAMYIFPSFRNMMRILLYKF